MNFPTLYKKASTGKIQVWSISVTPVGPIGQHGRIITEYGQLDGAKQTKIEDITVGKNIGKSNETNPVEQAEMEAQSRWEKKSQKHYVQSIEEAQAGAVDATYVAGGIAPMLAHKFHEQGHKIKWPAYVQPKLDGHRCIAIYEDGKVTLWSRQQKLITGVPHINRAIEDMLGGREETIILDGELYRHDELFEDLSSFIRQVVPKPGHEVVQYWIYDVVTDHPFATRKQYLDLLEELLSYKDYHNVYLSIVATFEAENDEAMRELFSVFMEQGYEGAMVRNGSGAYKNKRSYDLQKVKEFDDAEFKIVDVEEGRGTMKGRAIFVCEAPNGETFNAKMMGDLDNLAVIWENKNDYINKQLTVKYQGMSQYGIPRFPVGIRIYESV